jgi:hypothetical protein
VLDTFGKQVLAPGDTFIWNWIVVDCVVVGVAAVHSVPTHCACDGAAAVIRAMMLPMANRIQESHAIQAAAERSSSATVRPPSWTPPASWGHSRTIWRITVKGLPVDSMFFDNGEHVSRCALSNPSKDTHEPTRLARAPPGSSQHQ